MTEDRVIDLMDPETHSGDPSPLYAWLREEAPAYFDEANGIWAVSRYDDIVKISKDPDTFTSTEGNRPLLPPDSSFIHQDGPAHTARRNLVNPQFAPRAIDKMEGYLRDCTVDLIEAIRPRTTCEFVAEVAAPLPMRVIGDLCGIPREDHDQVRGWIDRFVKGGNGPLHVTEDVNDAFFSFAAYHDALVNQRRECPGQDLVSTWVHADMDGKRYDEEMLLFEHTMLLVGGSETTRNAISGGIEQLCRHPEQLAWLRENPDGMPNAVEEIIRWVTPFVSMSRVATRDAELHGKTIKRGQTVVLLYPAANRDPSKFKDPEVFDIQRKFDARPIAFGFGRHFCLGAHLARLEARVVLEEVLRRMPGLRLAGEPVWGRSSFIRGITELPLAFDA